MSVCNKDPIVYDTCHDLGHFSFDFFKTFFSAQCKQILEEKNIQTGNLTIFFWIFSNVVNFFLAFVLKCLKLVQFLYHELINVFTNLWFDKMQRNFYNPKGQLVLIDFKVRNFKN